MEAGCQPRRHFYVWYRPNGRRGTDRVELRNPWRDLDMWDEGLQWRRQILRKMGAKLGLTLEKEIRVCVRSTPNPHRSSHDIMAHATHTQSSQSKAEWAIWLYLEHPSAQNEVLHSAMHIGALSLKPLGKNTHTQSTKQLQPSHPHTLKHSLQTKNFYPCTQTSQEAILIPYIFIKK